MSTAASDISKLSHMTRLRIDHDSPQRFDCHFSRRWTDTWFLGLFALIWNVFVVFYFVMRLVGGFVNAKGPMTWEEISGVVVLTLVGMGWSLLWAWTKFKRTDVRVTPTAVQVIRRFFGWISTEETAFDKDTTADLRRISPDPESGGLPTFLIEIDGTDRLIEFGAELSEDESRFLLDRIQRVTGLPDSETARQRPSETVEYTSLPNRSQLLLNEDSECRLQIGMPPPGRHERSLRYISLIGKAVMALLSLIVVPRFLKNAAGFQEILVFFAVFGGFWLMLLVLTAAWLFQRFAEYELHVQPGYFSLHRCLLAWKSTRETRIDATCVAECVIWAGRGDDAEYAVQISGLDRTIRFGEMLSERDKRYLVHKLKLFLQRRQ